MIPETSCARVEPLLHAFEEGELTAEERELLLVHVAWCARCAAELCSEQALSSLLGAPAPTPMDRPRRKRRVVAAVLLVALAFALVPLIVPARPAFGQATLALAATPAATPLPQAWARSSGGSWPLTESNHVALAAGQTFSAALKGVGTIGATGPASFELERGAERWKLVLLRGQVRAEVEDGAKLLVVSARDARDYEAGAHVLDPDVLAQEPPADASVSQLLERGHAAFFQQQSFALAEACYRRARAHADATDAQKRDAHFYLVASLTRGEHHAEAVTEGQAFLERYPKDPSVHYLLLFHAGELRALGREKEARAAWQRIVDEDPTSDLADLARVELTGAAQPATGAGQKAPKSSDKYVPERVLPARTKPGGVAVVALGLDAQRPEDARFLAVAKKAAEFHETKVLALAPGDAFEADLEAALRAARSRSVLFVLPPRLLDVNLHRRVLLVSTRMDTDVFPDFSFGWLTARDGQALEGLWKRTQELRKQGLSSKRLMQSFVMGKAQSTIYADYGLDIYKSAGFQSSGIGFGCIEGDPKVLEFVDQHLSDLERAGVITMTGNGDPQGIWLFDDQRNMDRKRHWDFDPARVGRDEDGSMPRILAGRIAKLHLANPIVWSGTCHSGAVQRVFVEGDIVSTFGKTEKATLYDLEPKQSLALALLDAGAAALLVPIAANHGWSVDVEGEFAMANGASLGETIKTTWDDVFLRGRGELALDFQVPGAAVENHEPVMAGAGVNRLLIGDPTLAPFTATKHPSETVEVVKRGPNAFDVVVQWKAGHHPRFWDIFGNDRAQDARIFARVAIDELVPDELARRVSATVAVTDADKGEALPFELKHAEPEEFQGRRYLHLQANATRKVYENRALKAVFSVTLAPLTVETR